MDELDAEVRDLCHAMHLGMPLEVYESAEYWRGRAQRMQEQRDEWRRIATGFGVSATVLLFVAAWAVLR